MKKTRKFLIAIVLILFAALSAVPAFAQTPVSAEVDRSSLSTDETLLLTVRVNTTGGQPSSPVLPPLEDFALLGSSSGTQISYVNGKLSMSATFQYQLQPLRAGELVVDPVQVEVNGQTYNTDPIAVQVTQGNGQPPANPSSPGFGSLGNNFPFHQIWPFSQGFPSQSAQAAPPERNVDPSELPSGLAGRDLFVNAEVDNPTPYQGEQVIHTFRFYQAVDLFQGPTYSAPAFTGFWHQQQEDQTIYTIQGPDRVYQVTEVTTVLFPTVVGELEIEPAVLTIEGNLFQRGGALKTEPLDVNVQPLPPGAPASFNGAVGRFDLQAEVDANEVQVNDTLTYRLSLVGQGNLETVPDPQWTEGPEWRAFDTKATTSTRIENGKLVGVRTYERLLVPTTAGKFTLPPVEFSYFDPELESYQTVSTPSFQIRVLPDGSAAVPGSSASTASGESAAGPVNSLRPLKTSPEAAGAARKPITSSPSYWLLWALPLLLLAIHFGWSWQQKRLLSDPAARRSQAAARAAYRDLKSARKRKEDPYNAASRILTAYLTAKLDRPVSGLTHAAMTETLTQAGIDSRLVSQTLDCLALCEIGRYAPIGAAETAGGILAEAQNLIAQLEKSFT